MVFPLEFMPALPLVKRHGLYSYPRSYNLSAGGKKRPALKWDAYSVRLVISTTW